MSQRLAMHVLESGLPPHLRVIAAVLALFATDGGERIFPSVGKVAWLLDKGARAVRNDIAELCKLGVLEPIGDTAQPMIRAGSAQYDWRRRGGRKGVRYRMNAAALPPPRETWPEYKERIAHRERQRRDGKRGTPLPRSAGSETRSSTSAFGNGDAESHFSPARNSTSGLGGSGLPGSAEPHFRRSVRDRSVEEKKESPMRARWRSDYVPMGPDVDSALWGVEWRKERCAFFEGPLFTIPKKWAAQAIRLSNGSLDDVDLRAFARWAHARAAVAKPDLSSVHVLDWLDTELRTWRDEHRRTLAAPAQERVQ